MAAANPARTSWVPEEVNGNVTPLWYRPIEAYIPQNAQIIAARDKVYVPTARGLYALNAANGDLVWRFDTQLPIGNSPTVARGTLYVGGYDRKLHALNADTGQRLWAFNGADAGYSANPLVVDDRVLVGNRDGYFYAIGAHTSPNRGQMLWRYKTGSAIDQSAAYRNGVVYFASNDNYAYALRADNGQLVWKSAKLPGDGFHSYWPVVYNDKVVFALASGYRTNLEPGTATMKDASGTPYAKIYDMERDDLWGNEPENTEIGPRLSPQPWSNGYPVIDAGRITEYMESNPNVTARQHKPWRRAFVILNTSNGAEYTFDSDGDGNPEYAPIAQWGTHSGNRYPPIVGPNNMLYQSNIFEKHYIPQGRVMGWQFGTKYLSMLAGQGAVDEPQALSAGGETIYRVICCDRAGDFFSVRAGRPNGMLWNYSRPLAQLAPDYDQMWWGVLDGDVDRLKGNFGNKNGVYHNHGDQNPIVPYKGRLYVHRSNAVLSFGTGASRGRLPLLTAATVVDNITAPTLDELKSRLATEVQKIVNAGPLRPGYYNAGQFQYTQLANYFDNPGDMLEALTRAYPYLPTQLQGQVRTYLRDHFNRYFNPTMFARMGWPDGAAREDMPLPPEVQADLANHGKSTNVGERWPWPYPQQNFYGMWKYAAIFPADALLVYNLAKSKLQVPSNPDTSRWGQWPWELNGYITGYMGFLRLQELAGRSGADAALRTQVTNELNRLLEGRANAFTKDTPWVTSDGSAPGGGSYHWRTFNVSRNFIMLSPELGEYLNFRIPDRVRDALAEYNRIAPYWFVSRFNSVVNEGVMQNLYDYFALFQAKSYILGESRNELTKYLDVPSFGRGDLLYILNLVASIEAPPGPTMNDTTGTATTGAPSECNLSCDLNCSGKADHYDLDMIKSKIGTSDVMADLDRSGTVDEADVAAFAYRCLLRSEESTEPRAGNQP